VCCSERVLRGTFAIAARASLLLVLALVAWLADGAVASAQAPVASAPGASTTSSVVPTLGTAAAPAPAGQDDVTVETLEPSAVNRPLTSSEQRLESLDKWAVGGFVLLTLVVVVVRQRRRQDELAREDQPDDERDEWDAALEELTAQYRDEHRDGADGGAAGDR
jgi:hypothetical protein